MRESMILLESIDRAETLRYLRGGKRGGGTGGEPGPEMERLLSLCETELLAAISPRYVFRSFPILRQEEALLLADCRLPLEGRDIAAHLGGCEQAVLMAATLGVGPDRLIRISQINDMEKAVVYDAMASVAIEQVCDQIESVIRAKYPDLYLTWRFSPGYGDFPLALQHSLLTILDTPRQIGLTATDSFLLTPTKSVTALIGVSSLPLNRERRGCAGCSLCETCRFRQFGGHCR